MAEPTPLPEISFDAWLEGLLLLKQAMAIMTKDLPEDVATEACNQVIGGALLELRVHAQTPEFGRPSPT